MRLSKPGKCASTAVDLETVVCTGRTAKGALTVIYNKYPGLGNVAEGLHYLYIPWILLRVPLELTQ
jgi:hypothetical protein